MCLVHGWHEGDHHAALVSTPVRKSYLEPRINTTEGITYGAGQHHKKDMGEIMVDEQKRYEQMEQENLGFTIHVCDMAHVETPK